MEVVNPGYCLEEGGELFRGEIREESLCDWPNNVGALGLMLSVRSVRKECEAGHEFLCFRLRYECLIDKTVQDHVRPGEVCCIARRPISSDSSQRVSVRQCAVQCQCAFESTGVVYEAGGPGVLTG
jgi:hypothetical protein